MTGLLAAEVRKLSTARTTWILTAIGAVFAGVGAGFFLFEEEFSGPFTGSDPQVAAAIDQVGGMSVIVLVVGVLSLTTEFRHATIGRTLQITPSRTRVLAAKLAVGAVYGLVYFVAALAVVAVLIAIAASGTDLQFGSAVRDALWQGPVGLALTAVFGVAVGALLRSQVVAITVSLVYVMLVETLVNQFAPSVARWLPFQALNALFLSEEAMGQMPEGMVSPLAPATALGVFVAYVVVFSTAAVVLMRVRDV